MTTGRFIVVEGIDGSGTSTQAKLIGEALRRQRDAVHVTFEPSTGPIGRLLRRYLSGELAGAGEERRNRRLMAYLFAADRQEHLYDEEHGITSRLERGEDVVCARYVASSCAYEGDDEEELAFVRTLNASFPQPDLTVYLDCPVDVSLARLAATRDQVDIFENRDKLERVRDGYARTFEGDVGPVLVVDAQREPEAITADVVATLGLGGRSKG